MQKTTEEVSQNTTSPKKPPTAPRNPETLKNHQRANKAVMVDKLLQKEQGRSWFLGGSRRLSWASGDFMRLEGEDEKLVFPSTTAPSFELYLGRTGMQLIMQVAQKISVLITDWQQPQMPGRSTKIFSDIAKCLLGYKITSGWELLIYTYTIFISFWFILPFSSSLKK